MGEKKLDISSQVFKVTEECSGGVIIDLGATLADLRRPVSDRLNDEVQRLMNGLVQLMPGWGSSIPCFDGVIDSDLVGFLSDTFCWNIN